MPGRGLVITRIHRIHRVRYDPMIMIYVEMVRQFSLVIHRCHRNTHRNTIIAIPLLLLLLLLLPRILIRDMEASVKILPIDLHQFLIEMKLFHTMFRRVIILIITHNTKHGLVIGNVNAPIPPAPPAAVDPSLKPIPIP